MRRVKVNAVVVMQSNQVPDRGDRGHGLTSKMVMLPFQHSFLGREDFGLMAKLEGEMEGIARWCVEGARKVVEEVDPKRKVWTPSAAQADAEEIGVEGNPVRDFVRSCLKQGGKTTPEEIWRVWQVWAPKAGVSVGSTNRRGLSQRVKEEARWPIVSQRTAVQRYLDGVSVKAEWQLGGADAGE
jgi:phage/plasmid-associated DNA primase